MSSIIYLYDAYNTSIIKGEIYAVYSCCMYVYLSIFLLKFMFHIQKKTSKPQNRDEQKKLVCVRWKSDKLRYIFTLTFFNKLKNLQRDDYQTQRNRTVLIDFFRWRGSKFMYDNLFYAFGWYLYSLFDIFKLVTTFLYLCFKNWSLAIVYNY